jgi:hypothetical protein
VSQASAEEAITETVGPSRSGRLQVNAKVDFTDSRTSNVFQPSFILLRDSCVQDRERKHHMS